MPSLPPLRHALLLGLSFALLLGAPCARAELLFGRLVPAAPGTQPNNDSDSVDVSNDGKTVVFSSAATNWLPSPTGTADKAIAIDLDTGLIEVVSRTMAGVVLRGEHPSVSRDGRYVAFLNYGESLGPGVPSSSGWQAVRKDRQTGELKLASASAAGVPISSPAMVDDDSVSISGNGRYVAFEAANFDGDTPGYDQVYVKDMDTNALIKASVDNSGVTAERGCVLGPHALSDNGRYLVMICERALVPNAGMNQIYVRDLVQNSTHLVSRVGANGAASTSFASRPAISPNGRYVTFNNAAWGGLGFANGANVNGNSGIYLRNLQTQTTQALPKPALSGSDYDNCRISDVSDAGTVLMECRVPSLAGGAGSTNSQVFLHIPGASGTPFLISTGTGGDSRGNNESGQTLAIDASGLSLAFESMASNLVPGDTNNVKDIFVQVETTLLTELFSDGFED